jgi:hypothetical protein
MLHPLSSRSRGTSTTNARSVCDAIAVQYRQRFGRNCCPGGQTDRTIAGYRRLSASTRNPIRNRAQTQSDVASGWLDEAPRPAVSSASATRFRCDVARCSEPRGRSAQPGSGPRPRPVRRRASRSRWARATSRARSRRRSAITTHRRWRRRRRSGSGRRAVPTGTFLLRRASRPAC